MPGIVLELQKETLDKTIRVSDLLRKALLVARKLKVVEIEAWISSELNGYPESGEKPRYRRMTGELKAWNPYTGMWNPIIFPRTEAGTHQSLIERFCIQPIAEVENLIERTESGQLMMPFSAEIQATLIKAADLPSPPVLLVSESQLHGVLDAVRTAILEWTLSLEENGVLGENLSFSEADRKTASHITFNIGSVSHSQIQAEAMNSQQVMVEPKLELQQLTEFIIEVRKALPGLALGTEAKDEIDSEVSTLEAQVKSPRPKKGILQESLKSIRNVLEGAAGNAVAEGLLQVIPKMFG